MYKKSTISPENKEGSKKAAAAEAVATAEQEEAFDI